MERASIVTTAALFYFSLASCLGSMESFQSLQGRLRIVAGARLAKLMMHGDGVDREPLALCGMARLCQRAADFMLDIYFL